MNYRIRHRTRYAYSEPAVISYNEVRLCPRDLTAQSLISKTITVEPAPSELRQRVDYFGNPSWFVAIDQPHTKMTVAVESHVRIDARPQEPDQNQLPTWEAVRDCMTDGTDPDAILASEFILDSPLISKSAQLKNYAQPSFAPAHPLIAAIVDLMQRIYRDFEFKPGFSDVSTSLDRVLEHRQGVCQDFAQLAIGCLRSMGLPARYVSGYIETLPPPGREKLKGADASHAWFSAFIPGYGWIDFDPTNNQIPSDQHIIVAYGRDYSDVTPIKGVVFSAGRHKLTVSVDVERIDAADAFPAVK